MRLSLFPEGRLFKAICLSWIRIPATIIQEISPAKLAQTTRVGVTMLSPTDKVDPFPVEIDGTVFSFTILKEYNSSAFSDRK